MCFRGNDKPVVIDQPAEIPARACEQLQRGIPDPRQTALVASAGDGLGALVTPVEGHLLARRVDLVVFDESVVRKN